MLLRSYHGTERNGSERNQMKYSKETIRSAKEICAKVFENKIKEMDAYRMARKMGQDRTGAKEIYRNMMSK